MPSPRITLYTGHGCHYCGQVRQFLQRKQLTYFEIPTDDNLAAINTVRQLTGNLMVPVTVISSEAKSDIVVVGFDSQKLEKALKDAS